MTFSHLPDLWGLSYPSYFVYGKFGPRVYNVLRISLLAKKKFKRWPKKRRKKSVSPHRLWSRLMTRNQRLFVGGLTITCGKKKLMGQQFPKSWKLMLITFSKMLVNASILQGGRPNSWYTQSLREASEKPRQARATWPPNLSFVSPNPITIQQNSL